MLKGYRGGIGALLGVFLLALLASNYGWFVPAHTPVTASAAEASVRSGSSHGYRGGRGFFGGGYGGGFRGGK